MTLFRSTLSTSVYTWPHFPRAAGHACACHALNGLAQVWSRSWWHVSRLLHYYITLHYDIKQQLYTVDIMYHPCSWPLALHVHSHVISCHSCQWTSYVVCVHETAVIPKTLRLSAWNKKQLSNHRCNSKWQGHAMKVTYIFTCVQDANNYNYRSRTWSCIGNC